MLSFGSVISLPFFGIGLRDKQCLICACFCRCCDHPQLTSFWRQMGQEMQLQGAGRAGVLTIAEANTRLADFAQNKLQVRLSALIIRCMHIQ